MRYPEPYAPNVTALLAPGLAGGLNRFAAYAAFGRCIVDCSIHHDKRRKETHRFAIADTRGRIELTIPVAKPTSYRAAMETDILISGHSPWWTTIMTSLESAYGRTPYFEFYADDFRELFVAERVATPITNLTQQMDLLICRLGGIPAPEFIMNKPEFEPLFSDSRQLVDFRHKPLPELPSELRYPQIRESKLGFIPNLSALDALFSLGPEFALLIYDISGKIFQKEDSI